MVEKIHVLKLSQVFLRVKWNLCGTCFAGSAEDGSVTLWKREQKLKFIEVAHLQSK